jgi:hypothetical protein
MTMTKTNTREKRDATGWQQRAKMATDSRAIKNLNKQRKKQLTKEMTRTLSSEKPGEKKQ